ncbi:UNVERIFIED_CONTAM: hypothetical protein PYX00_006557 [Menopon gallinae]|uniref:Tyrosine-protein phosphatase non-receptor type 23 n=1 Tax=Menopon gallinae TaxID=328185 RepID=A0AAW2HWV4_9NEOP
MEALPRLPMLSFELRQSPEPADFGPKLKQFIRNHYNEDPELFSNDVNQLEGLRSSAVRPTRDVEGCRTLKRYYCQLHFLSSRFPMQKDGAAAVKFTWKNLGNNSVNSAADISLEMSSVLYNIGALHTQLGASDNRTTADGMKMSCSHFQCAAWAFQHVCEEYAQTTGLDLSLDLMSFMAKLCLGQAQECILEKSMLDNRKSTIIAKVAVQTVDYYKQALKIITEASEDSSFFESAGPKVCKKWDRYLKFKVSYHGCIARLFQGQQAEEQQKMGERVAYYQAAFDKLEEARKLAKDVDNIEVVNEALSFVHDVVEGKRNPAKRENEFIYHEEIPDINVLPEVQGASLVKGIPFNVNDIEVSGPDIFSRIVPMKAHELSSLYSEEKAKLLRKVSGMIETKDEEIQTFLSALELDDLNKTDGNQLPQELIDRCAALSAKPDAIKNLFDSMNKLSNIYHDVESMLQEIKEMLNEEEIHEKEYQETVGKRPPTIAATDLTREAKRYQEAHSKASESNQTLHKAMVMHVANMELLSLPPKELINRIPPVVESPEVEAVTNEMRHLMDKVNEMQKQRAMLSNRLREAVYQDDILRQVVTYTGENLQDLFDSELQKHQRTVSLIEQNLAAQENIIKATKETYARYGKTRRSTAEMRRRRDAMISSLIASYDAYEDLLAKSSKGLDFYKKLEVNVSKLLQRVKGTCKVQDEEREQIIKNVKNSESHEAPPANPLKLKDYLEMKKEFGKLSLDNSPVPPANAYYKPTMNEHVPSQSWIPGVRPAPVGSEETDPSRVDSLSGLYQGQSRDQTWSNPPYASNVDDRMKYYAPQAPVSTEARYPTETNSQSMPQDIYPISAYSSVMQNTSSTGYTGPKSNYYNTQNSPSRYINPPHFYSDYNQPVVTSYGATQMPVTAPKYVAESVAPSQPSAYGYSYPTSVPSQSGYTTAGFPNQTEVPASTYSQAAYQYPTSSESKLDAGLSQVRYSSYSSESVDPYGVSQNSTVTSQVYAQYTTSYTLPDSSKLSSYSPGLSYSNTVSPQPVNFSSQETGYVTPQSYQVPATPAAYTAASDKAAASYYTPDTSTLPQDYSKMQGPYGVQQYPDSYNPSWQQGYDPSSFQPSQHLQSGNESLYTACQTNNYSLTNSEVYKNDGQYNQPGCSNQYYVNQYGSCNGQSEFGLNYGNAATYMQAGMDKQQATTTTTYSNSDAKSSPTSEHSNVDLLAGLDFNISHSPLVPESTAPTDAKPKTEKPAEKVESKPVETQIKESPPEKDSVEKLKKEQPSPPQQPQPLKDAIDVDKLNQDVEKYEKFVESLTLKTLNGPTCLDVKWKEISDLQDKSAHLHIISVARCYPMKNRFPDILPYDDSRIELPSTKDDYINASFVKKLSSYTPNFILTQAPLQATYSDFWAMVFEQQVEVIVCLLSDSELEGNIYWPTEKGQELAMGKLKISLQSSNVRTHWIERIMSLCVAETRVTRVVVHLQFTSWPGSSFPESPGPFLSFASECINFFNQQRSSSHPAVVHCISGVGRTGLFCLIVAAILEIQAGKGIPDLVAITGQMSQYRKSPLRDREHLKFAYQAVLYYCQDLLMKQCPGSKTEEPKSCRSQSVCSMSNSCTSSGRTSPSSLPSDVLSGLDPAAFSLKLDGNKGKKSGKRYSSESFTKKTDLNLDGFNTDSDDPLSRLDPLWTMKK